MVKETENGVLLTPFDPDLRDAMQAFDEVRRQYRNTLEKLADELGATLADPTDVGCDPRRTPE